MKIDITTLKDFELHLIETEKAAATREKYLHDVRAFGEFLSGEEITKSKALEYKDKLLQNYAPASVNGAIASLNCFFDFANLPDCKLKNVKIQRQIFMNKKKELTKGEYERLLRAAKRKKNKRLYYLIQTICSTGIRVSELKAITVEAVKCGYAKINCKGKMRMVILPRDLCNMLDKYVKSQKIKRGAVFVTRNGNPMDRSNIWHDMKSLCRDAKVGREKVFPHNLRHLFARTYYSIEKDIVRLADILGHSSVNTTRIYTMETGEVHRRQIEKLGFLRC